MEFKLSDKIYVGIAIALVIIVSCFFHFEVVYENNIFDSNKNIVDTKSEIDKNLSLDLLFYYSSIVSESMLLDNVSKCDEIDNEYYLNICRNGIIGCEDDDCYLELAFYHNDEKICEYIDNEIKQGFCSVNMLYSKVVNLALMNKDVLQCDILGEFNKDICISDYYFHEALEFQDSSKCELIIITNIKSICYKELIGK